MNSLDTTKKDQGSFKSGFLWTSGINFALFIVGLFFANLQAGSHPSASATGGNTMMISLGLMVGQALWLPIGLVVMFLGKRPNSAGGIIAAGGVSAIVFFGMCFGGLFQGLSNSHY